MEQKINVEVRPSQIDGMKVWLIKFRYDENLKEEIKSLLNARWKPELKCWWVRYDNKVLNTLRLIRGIELNIEYAAEEKDQEKEIAASDYLWEYKDKVNAENMEQLHLSASVISDLVKWQEKLVAKQYSPRTIASYMGAIKLFLVWLKDKNHKEVRKEDIESYMYFLVKERNVSRSYQNLHVNALKLFYKEIMSIYLSPEMISRPRREYKFPHYLTREEVSKIFFSIGNVKHRAMISIVYACGLRLGEVIRIKLKDIDASQGLLMIRQSKGNKDRVVPIPESILYLLNDYANVYKPKVYLFEGQKAGESYSERSLQEVFKAALRKSTIQKQEATLHWLRHSYATHLLEMGTNIRDLQTLLGHKNVKTTEGYTHISSTKFKRIVSPFDVLPEENNINIGVSNLKKLYF